MTAEKQSADYPLVIAALQAHNQHLHEETAKVAGLLGALAGDGRAAEDLVREISLSTISRWHFEMLNDAQRREAYQAVIDERIRPGMHVLDIGSGCGLLALMAARSGAQKVTTCEGNPLMAAMAARVVLASGLNDRITVVPKMSTDLRVGVDLDRRVDLIVSEIVDCGLVGEGLLRSIRHARHHLLAPGGRLIPQTCRVMGALISSSAIRSLNQVGLAAGFDVSLLNLASTPGHFPVRLWTRPHELLSAPAELARFDLARDPLVDDDHAVLVDPDLDGVADGIVAWFEMDLGNGLAVTNSPDNRASHWAQAFIPFGEPVPVHAKHPLPVNVGWHNDRLTARVVTVNARHTVAVAAGPARREMEHERQASAL